TAAAGSGFISASAGCTQGTASYEGTRPPHDKSSCKSSVISLLSAKIKVATRIKQPRRPQRFCGYTMSICIPVRVNRRFESLGCLSIPSQEQRIKIDNLVSAGRCSFDKISPHDVKETAGLTFDAVWITEAINSECYALCRQTDLA